MKKPNHKLEVLILKAQEKAQADILFAPASFRNGNPVLLFEVCNGCGAANAKFDFVPDRIYGTYIGYACHIHDWMYNVGHTIEDKEEADRVFLNNMLRIIDRENKWYKPTFLMRIRARNYYRAIRAFGGPAFWAGKNRT